jgi:hypothetical protein
LYGVITGAKGNTGPSARRQFARVRRRSATPPRSRLPFPPGTRPSRGTS